jgi:hypothetical protein
VVPHPDVRPEELVLPRDDPQRDQRVVLAARPVDVERAPEPDALGDGGVDEGVEAAVPQLPEHRRDLVGRRADVARNEGGVLDECGGRGGADRGHRYLRRRARRSSSTEM